MNDSSKIQHYWETIVGCPLFKNITSEYIEEMIHSLNGHINTYSKNEIIIGLGDEFRYCGIILEGTVEVSYNTIQYEKLNVNHFKKGQIFGEALALRGVPFSPVQITAFTNCTLLLIDLRSLVLSKELCGRACMFNHQLLLNLMDRMSEQNVFSNLKLRILGQKSLRDRIMIYLTHLYADGPDGAEIPFSQTSLAEFLGVNRSALSRELGRMQDEGVLEVRGKRYRIL